MTTIEACPSCAHREHEAFTFGDVDLRRCARCGLVHRPEVAHPDDLYTDDYLTADGIGIDTTDPDFGRWLTWCADLRLRWLAPLLGPSTGSWFDVGCGSGEVLDAAARAGYRTHGVEPVDASAARARARGHEVRTGDLSLPGLGRYDVVSAFHVLEHVADPVGLLRRAAHQVAPGGHVVVEVPNWASAERDRFGRRWTLLRPLEHVSHFTPDTLASTMQRAGLRVEVVTTKGFLWPEAHVRHYLRTVVGPDWRSRPVARQAARLLRKRDRVAYRLARSVEAARNRRGHGQVVLAVART